MTSNFVHLRVHTDHSLTDSLVRVKDLIGDKVTSKHKAIAITDDANIYNGVKFYEKTRDKKVKPILGAEVYVSTPYGEDKLPVLCKDDAGYKNLMLMLSLGSELREKEGLNPAIPLEEFLSKSSGLVVFSGGNGSLLSELLLSNKDQAYEYANTLKSRIGQDYFIELQRIGMKNEAEYIELAVGLASDRQIPVVATNDVMFMDKEDYETHEIRSAIPLKQTLQSIRQSEALYTPEQYLKTPEEMTELFKDIPSAISNTISIAKKCNFTMELGEIYLPDFPVDEGYDDASFLEKLSKDGLSERLEFLYPDPVEREAKRPSYDARLKHEIDVINNMGFPGYFLIVMEFIQWSKDNDIPVGPGRGSGAGSLVAYALKITDLDPLEYDLLFERFLNPERVSMPDFDVDFCQTGRDRVIEHVADFYGKEAVSQIITFGTMAARSVVKDVTRVLGHPYMFGDRISKLIPDKPGTKLQDAVDTVPALSMLIQEDPKVAEIIKHALKLEGLTRQVGKHAGGVLIAPTKISDFSPIYKETTNKPPVSQFDKDDVEKRGLVKFDFLGLKTLSVVKMAIDIANKKLGKDGQELLHSEKIPLNDKGTYKLLQEGNTTGVFQLESAGMKNLCQRLNPENFEEIIALVALYRPGPLDAGMVDTFINCKKGIEEIHYPHPSLEQILDVTNGVFVYQEQVMQAAQIMAGYSLGQADLLRRAMGKKKPEEMAKQRVMFTEGSVANGVSEDDAKHVFDLMETFAGYGFNKSHSAAYAMISVITAYLKHHHPAPFYAATLSYDTDKTEKVVRVIHDAKENGVNVIPPCINLSEGDFGVNDKDEVTYGLSSIGGLGDTIREKILTERDSGGEYKDMFDFMTRVNPNIRVLMSCIYSGAFDGFGDTRAEMHSYASEASSLHKKMKERLKNLSKDNDGQGDMLESNENIIKDEFRQEFKRVKNEFKHSNIITEIELIKEERKRLGLYMSKHPSSTYHKEIESESPTKLSVINSMSGEDILLNEKEQNGNNVVTIVGSIVDIDVKNNKKGQTAALTIDDGTGQIKVRLNNKMYGELFHMVNLDETVSIKMHMSYSPNSERFWYKPLSLKDIDMVRQQNVDNITLNIDLNNPDKKERVKRLLSETEKGTFKIRVRNIGQTDEPIFPIGDGRVVSDEFLEQVKVIADSDEPFEINFKTKSNENDRKGNSKAVFENADDELIQIEMERANKALREAKEIMGLTL